MSLLVCSSFNSKQSSQAGSSLLELAIVLVILGIIGGMSLPLLTGQLKRAAFVKTKANQEYALDAIAAFVERKGRFPCPADPQVTGAEYGRAQIACPGQKAQGILPFRTLGISESYAKDGFKRLMTYSVEPSLTDMRNENLAMTVEGGKLSVKNEDGHSVLPTEEKKPGLTSPNFIALVLICHGESGIGAYIGNGQTTRMTGTSTSPHKRENLDGNFVFFEKGQTDDIVRWESRDQFLKHYVKRR